MPTVPGSVLSYLPFVTSVWRGPPTDHFDGERFANQTANEHGGARDMVRLVRSGFRPWRRITDATPGPPPPERVHEGLRVTFVGHATCLVQADGLNVLTDPVWGERASALSWLGPRRYRPPGIRFDDLPPIDVVLLSHNHYDHLCAPTMRRLAAQQPLVLAPLGNGAMLRHLGLTRVIELDWWDEHTHQGAVFTFTPARHFAGRGLSDRDKSLWGSFFVRSARHSVYFAGDTAMGDHFAQTQARCGSPELALLPIGAYLPAWFMQRVHTSPAQAVQAARLLGASTSVPIHYGTFRLSQEGMDEPLDDLAKALGDDGPRFVVLEPGQAHVVAAR